MTAARIAAVAGVLVGLVAGCAAPPPPTARQQAELDAARGQLQRCVGERLDQLGGVTPAAARALARSVATACRVERDAFETLALTTLGEEAGEAEMLAMQAWIFGTAEQRTLERRW